MSDFDIIDPPITPYSSEAEIKAWITDLEKREKTQSVIESIKQAKEWLRWKNDEQ